IVNAHRRSHIEAVYKAPLPAWFDSYDLPGALLKLLDRVPAKYRKKVLKELQGWNTAPSHNYLRSKITELSMPGDKQDEGKQQETGESKQQDEQKQDESKQDEGKQDDGREPTKREQKQQEKEKRNEALADIGEKAANAMIAAYREGASNLNDILLCPE